MSLDRLIEVYRAKNGLQAHFFKSALEQAGIKACVDEQDGLSELGSSQLMGWNVAPRIMVFAADVADAREVLRRLEQSEQPEE